MIMGEESCFFFVSSNFGYFFNFDLACSVCFLLFNLKRNISKLNWFCVLAYSGYKLKTLGASYGSDN